MLLTTSSLRASKRQKARALFVTLAAPLPPLPPAMSDGAQEAAAAGPSHLVQGVAAAPSPGPAPRNVLKSTQWDSCRPSRLA